MTATREPVARRITRGAIHPEGARAVVAISESNGSLDVDWIAANEAGVLFGNERRTPAVTIARRRKSHREST